jgi:anti-anti-sigma regulatory factor
MDIACAADFKNLLIEALASGKELQLDLQKTEDLDLTALQLLWAAEREAKGSGRSFVLAGPLPAPLSERCSDAGFERFPIPAAIR